MARADLFEDSAECLVGGHVEHDVLVRWRVAVSRVHLPQRRVAVGDVIEAHRDDVNVTQSLVVDELVQTPEACTHHVAASWRHRVINYVINLVIVCVTDSTAGGSTA